MIWIMAGLAVVFLGGFLCGYATGAWRAWAAACKAVDTLLPGKSNRFRNTIPQKRNTEKGEENHADLS